MFIEKRYQKYKLYTIYYKIVTVFQTGMDVFLVFLFGNRCDLAKEHCTKCSRNNTVDISGIVYFC